MSIRRFTNPHPVLQQLQIVSRTDLYAEHDRPNQIFAGDIERLQSYLTETLQPVNSTRDEDGSRSLPRTKRRKVVRETTSLNTVRMYYFTFLFRGTTPEHWIPSFPSRIIFAATFTGLPSSTSAVFTYVSRIYRRKFY